MATPSLVALLIFVLGSLAIAEDAPSGASVGGVVAGLYAPTEEVRAKALADVESWIRRDPAAALGALPGLRDVLRHRTGPERARVAALLLRLPGEEAASAWASLLDPSKEEDDRVHAAAIEAVACRADDPLLARRLLDIVRDAREDPSRRALCLEALGGMRGPAVPLLLNAQRPGATWVEESCRALALGRRGGSSSVGPLIELLAHAHASPRVHAWESLVRITHRDLPPRRDVWDAWWKSQEGKLPVAAVAAADGPAPADPYAVREPTHVPQYYGIPVRGKASTSRVVFCLDVSASMSEKGIEPARRHLEDTIRECATSVSFDVVAFNDQVYPWAGRTVRAHPVQKARAIAWLDAIVPKSYTNIYDAVESAFETMGRGRKPAARPEKLDAVFLLSDGAPNRGRYFAAKEVVRAISELSMKQVPVHAIGVGDAMLLPLLQDIAAATGGTFVSAFE